MRPAGVVPADSAPCCSGRGAALAPPGRPSLHSRRGQWQRPLAMRGGKQEGARQGPSAAPPPPGRTAAYAAAFSFGSQPAVAAVSPSREPVSSRDMQLEQQEVWDPAAAAAEGLDYDGRPAVGRRKPLKINQDLALYRVRQTRIAANRSPDQAQRTRLLREAETALRRVLASDPEDGRPYVSLGKLLVQQRRFAEAAALYEEGSTATGGTNAYIWTAWANLASRQGNPGLARKLFDAAIVARVEHAAAWHGWGLLEKRQGNVVRARDLWAKGIQATRGDPSPYLYQSLAVLAAEMECLEEARRWFRQGTRTVKGAASHALWQAWALMERKDGDPEIVRGLFRKGLDVSPRSRYTFLAWGLWEKSQGKDAEARRLLRAGAQANPRDAPLLQAWALLEEEAGQVDEARRLFRRASRVDPSHLPVWQAWGCAEFRAGNYEQARELFQQGIWTAPPRARDTALIFQAWAVLEQRAGNTSLARELYKAAVKADTRSETSWLSWAAMEEDLGAIQRASELRSFSMQERVEVVRPAGFTTLPPEERSTGLQKLFASVSSWFARYEAAGAPLPTPRPSSPSFESWDDEETGLGAPPTPVPVSVRAGSSSSGSGGSPL